jgi:O-antigen/teichoic acid export membrane protein
VAGIEISYGLSDFGLSWLAARYLPEYRIYASGKQLKIFCTRYISITAFFLLVFDLIFVIFLDDYLEWVGLANYRIVALIYLGVFFLDGLGRCIREPLMVPLMMIDASRKSMVMRQFTFVLLICLLEYTGNVSLNNVAWSEIVAVFISLVVSIILMKRCLLQLRDNVTQLNWFEPRMVEIMSMALRMYVANLLTLPSSPQAFINIIQRTLGTELAGLFSFLLNLQAQIARYLPATLLFSIIRPKLVSSYVGGGGMPELSRNANLAAKLSLFALMPLIIVTALVGDPLLVFLSNGKFMNCGWLFFGLMLVLVPMSQGQLIESVAVASGHSALCTIAAAGSLIALPVIWLLISFDMGLWSAVLAFGLGRLVFNLVMVIGVSKLEGYKIDVKGFLKLSISAILTYYTTLWISSDEIFSNNFNFLLLTDIGWTTSISLILRSLLSVLIYFSFSWWVKPFTSSERLKINTWSKYQFFVW